MSSGDSKVEKIAVNFRELSFVASTLNSASDELTTVVAVLDEALRTLNIGITAWTTFKSYMPDSASDVDDEQVGYCKVNGKWGIAIQRVWGDYNRGDFETEGPWLFSDAPREMRLNSVDKIPELIGALSQRASETAKKIQDKTQEVRELAGVIDQITKLHKAGLPQPPPPLVSPKSRASETPSPYMPNPDRSGLLGLAAQTKKGGK